MPRSHRGTTSQAGYDWAHQKRRAELLAAHVDGTRCPCPGDCGPRCPCRAAGCAPGYGLPMYRDSALNPDGRPLQADHSRARVLGGQQADRLMLAVCNLSRGAALGNRMRGARRRGQGVRVLPEW